MKAEDLPDGIWDFESGDGRFAGALFRSRLLVAPAGPDSWGMLALVLPRRLTIPSGSEPA